VNASVFLNADSCVAIRSTGTFIDLGRQYIERQKSLSFSEFL